MDGQTCSVLGFIRNGWSDLFSYGVYKKWMVRLVQLYIYNFEIVAYLDHFWDGDC